MHETVVRRERRGISFCVRLCGHLIFSTDSTVVDSRGPKMVQDMKMSFGNLVPFRLGLSWTHRDIEWGKGGRLGLRQGDTLSMRLK